MLGRLLAVSGSSALLLPDQKGDVWDALRIFGSPSHLNLPDAALLIKLAHLAQPSLSSFGGSKLSLNVDPR